MQPGPDPSIVDLAHERVERLTGRRSFNRRSRRLQRYLQFQNILRGMVHIAVYDAVVAIEGGYEPFVAGISAPAGSEFEPRLPPRRTDSPGVRGGAADSRAGLCTLARSC